MPAWLQHASRAVEMSFNWLHIDSQSITRGFLAAFRLESITTVINPQILPPHTEKGNSAILEQTLRGFWDLD